MCSVVPNSSPSFGRSPPGSSVLGISQAKILEWVAFPSPGDLPDPGIKPVFPALQADSLPLVKTGYFILQLMCNIATSPSRFPLNTNLENFIIT